MTKEKQRFFVALLQCADICIGMLSITAAFGLRFYVMRGGWDYIGLSRYLAMMIPAIPVYFLLYHLFELYDTLRYKPLLRETEKIIIVNLIGLGFLYLLSFFLREVDVSRLLILLFAGINTTLSALTRISLRFFLRSLRRRGFNRKRLLLVGWNESAGEFYDKLSGNTDFGYDVVGYLGEYKLRKNGRDVPYRGEFSDLEEILKTRQIDEVVISLDYKEFPLLAELIEVCEREGVKSGLLPFYTKYLPTHPYIDEIDGMPLINLRRVPLDAPFAAFAKRMFDLCGASVLLVLLSPLLAVTAVVIRISSTGAIIYQQQRIGRGKREFIMYKFRSMREGDGDMTAWGTRRDERRTKFGAFIRKYSIDELPQLWNVIKGDMSLVGPRPERPFFVDKFRDEVPLYMLKHLVRPGITGWAQVKGWRGDTSIVERVKCDLFYIENWSFLLDIKILLMTLCKGFVNPSEEL